MVLIAGLISAALETSEMRRPNRNALVRRDNSHDDQPDSQHDTSSEVSQDQIDERAFQEVQNYADFQRELSERVYDDILKEGTYGYPRSSLDTSVFPSICQNFLPAPIIIPQQRSEGGKSAWRRAYAPSLLICGIDQDTFLHFIDSYNEVTKNSPFLRVVNFPALWARPTPSMTQTSVSRAIPMAVSLAKTVQSQEQSNFLRHANDELFVPRGLFALVVTFNHSRNSQTYTVDISQPSPTVSTRHAIKPQQQIGAPLIFPEVDTDSDSPKKPPSEIKSPQKRRRRMSSDATASSRSTDGFLKRSIEGASTYSREEGQSSLTGAVKRMINGPGKEERGFMQRIKAKEMDEDVLYLMIVNNFGEADVLKTAVSSFHLPFHGEETAKAPDPGQKGLPDSNPNNLRNDRVQQGDDPPPGYNAAERPSNDAVRRKSKNHCVPTL